MNTFKIALVRWDAPAVPEWVPGALAKEGITLVAHECVTREDLSEHAADADVVWIFGGAHRSMRAENLDVLQRCGAILRTGSGTDDIPVAKATELGIIVANTPYAMCDEVADHAIGFLLAVVRQIPIHDRLIRKGIWDRNRGLPNWQLQGRTLGLVGFGHVAQAMAGKLRGFEMNALAYDPYVGEDTMQACGVQRATLEEVLTCADFVSVHCPLTEGTFHLLGEPQLRLMKPTAVLINTARGSVLDETALERALRERWIAAAGLDVLEKQPPEPDNPLLKLDNVVFTPHIAAFSDQYFEKMWQKSVETLTELSHGRWPPSYVNKEVKPRWESLTSIESTSAERSD